jgi:hypothetical protein
LSPSRDKLHPDRLHCEHRQLGLELGQGHTVLPVRLHKHFVLPGTKLMLGKTGVHCHEFRLNLSDPRLQDTALGVLLLGIHTALRQVSIRTIVKLHVVYCKSYRILSCQDNTDLLSQDKFVKTLISKYEKFKFFNFRINVNEIIF